MDDAKKLAMLEEMMDLDEATLTKDMVLEDIVEYDSMAKLSLIVLMDDEFGKKITSKEIKNFRTVQDILNFMC